MLGRTFVPLENNYDLKHLVDAKKTTKKKKRMWEAKQKRDSWVKYYLGSIDVCVSEDEN